MGWDEPPDERLRRTRVLALSHPKWVMRGVIDGLRACGVDVFEAHLEQTQAVLDHMHAARADVVLAYADEVVHLGLRLAEQVPVVCVVPFGDPGAWRAACRSAARAVVRLAPNDEFEPDWIALIRALQRWRPREASDTVRGRALVVERPKNVMEPVARALQEGRLEVTTSLGLTARDVLIEYACAGAEVVVAYADPLGEALSDASSLPLLLAYRVTDGPGRALANRLRPGATIEVPLEEERVEPATRGAWSKARAAVEWAARTAHARECERELKRDRERAGPSREAKPPPSGSWPNLDDLTRSMGARIRARKYGTILAARPIHVDTLPTVTPPLSRSLDEILGDDAPRPFLQTYGVAYDGVAPEELPAYVRRKLLESTGDAPGATEAFAIEALRAFASDEERLRATVHAIVKSPIDPSPVLKGHVAKALYRLGEHARAEALVQGIVDPDGRVLAADIAEARHDLPRALASSEAAVGERLDTLGAVERVARWRRALSVKSEPPKVRTVVPLRLRGEPWTIVFEERPVLGRVDAAIVVGAPLVSRRHLEFHAAPDAAEVEDLGSQHGTYVEGARLRGALRIDRPRELRLANIIACSVRPASAADGRVAAVVEVADARWLLAFGSAVDVGALRLERSGTTLTASAHTGLLHVDGGPAPGTGACVTLHPGVKIRFGAEAPPEVEIEADAFET